MCVCLLHNIHVDKIAAHGFLFVTLVSLKVLSFLLGFIRRLHMHLTVHHVSFFVLNREIKKN